MISQPANRVQAIKSRFENLNSVNQPLIRNPQLNKQSKSKSIDYNGTSKNLKSIEKHDDSDSSEELLPKPNTSYLYNKNDAKINDCKSTLTRQVSDPGKKLQRSHAFRCDRSAIVTPTSPKRHGSCYGRSETSEFGRKMGEKKLSKDRLDKLSNVLEDQMRKENFVCHQVAREVCDLKNSIPDSEVPKHIIEQYAQVIKPKKKDDKQEAMTDSGVSSETENLEEDKSRIKLLRSHFEKTEPTDTNLLTEPMTDLCVSTETMKLARKNPNLILTDTLKKALKQPLPAGPPPKKPPRAFNAIQESPEPKKDPKKMLEKLEQVLQKREEEKTKNTYDIPETNLSSPKEVHYLCTEILDITQRTLLPNQNNSDVLKNCFNSLNCAIVSNSTSSLPYTRLSSHSNRDSFHCPCSNNFDGKKRLSTFSNGSDDKCHGCQQNDGKHNEFKCHLNCKCKMSKSEFFLPNEHIYDVPNIEEYAKVRRGVETGQYGSLNNKGSSKSMEDLRISFGEDQKIYDIPCEISRPPTPEFATSSPKTDFQKLRDNFENPQEKPMILSPKPILKTIQEKEDRDGERIFATEVRRYKRKGRSDGFMTAPRNSSQIVEDKENLNRLMNEIYDTVAAMDMSENKINSFPTEQEGSDDAAVKLTRSLTEKRKNYVRRVSSKVAYLDKANIKQTRFRHQTSVCSYKSEIIDNPYSTFRSWKSFRVSQKDLTKDKMDSTDSKSDLTDSKCNLTDSSGNLLSMKDEFDGDKLSIDGKMGCVDIELPFEPREGGLFDVCMLVGMNHMTGEAYVKSVFPSQVRVPPHIENLVFPETMSDNKMQLSGDSAQCYSLVLTDERGERGYGYCRRVLPEGATTCLPLCYCVIGRYRAPGFYYKVLQEIESHHGSSEVNIQNVLQQFLCSDLPPPGEEVTITRSGYTDIVEFDQSTRDTVSEGFPDCYDVHNNQDVKRFTLNVMQSPRKISIKRPIDPRWDEDNLSILLDHFGTGLLIKVFGSLLLERKVVVISDQLSVLSSCMEALQSILYPFVWQQPLISTIPCHIHRDVLEAPLPILAGMLRGGAEITGVQFEEGMLIDLTHPSKVLYYQGDETTILPTTSFKSLKNSLQMELIKHKDRSEDTKTRNVLISETFLRFFVDILGDFWKYFSFGIVGDGGLGKDGVVFDKENYIKNATSKQNQYFLEWFTETAMFNHFIQNMSVIFRTRREESCSQNTTLVDTPLPDFYELFEARVNCRGRRNSNGDGKNYKSAVNKKVRLLKNKLRELVA